VLFQYIFLLTRSRPEEGPHRDVTYHTTADNIEPEKLVKEKEKDRMKTTYLLILCLAKTG
jgi:hypothetical protein